MSAFYDKEKTDEENREAFREANHNKEVLQYATAAIALFTAVCTAALVSNRCFKEFG